MKKLMTDEKSIRRSLQSMPNIGPAMAGDFISMGIYAPEDLKGKDPVELYRRLEQITQSRQDPCVLDTFMAAVHFANTGERRSWWSFTSERKALLAK